jgi:hypothetical protein
LFYFFFVFFSVWKYDGFDDCVTGWSWQIILGAYRLRVFGEVNQTIPEEARVILVIVIYALKGRKRTCFQESLLSILLRLKLPEDRTSSISREDSLYREDAGPDGGIS